MQKVVVKLEPESYDEYGWIYVIQAGTTNHYKIGWTQHSPEKRRAELQTGSHLPLYVVGAFRARHKTIEAKFHKMCESKRLHGEWFELEDHELHEIIDPDQRLFLMGDIGVF